MFQIFVLEKKIKEKIGIMFLKLFLNAMIKNNKIHNILDIIELSKSMEFNKCIHTKTYENVHLNVSYDFSKFDGSKKMKV
jgi:hypothetical protein